LALIFTASRWVKSH